jgi:hypothetical protein
VAIIFITASLGHIYIGTLGMEGAAESMTQGYVDSNWAAEHHNLWLAEMEAAGMVGVSPNTMEEVKRHDDRDFRGYGRPTARADKATDRTPGAGTAEAANPSSRKESL